MHSISRQTSNDMEKSTLIQDRLPTNTISFAEVLPKCQNLATLMIVGFSGSKIKIFLVKLKIEIKKVFVEKVFVTITTIQGLFKGYVSGQGPCNYKETSLRHEQK